MADQDPMSVMMPEFLGALEKIDPGRFLPVEVFEDIPGRVYFESRHWGHMLFHPKTDPHAPDNAAKHSYYVAADEADYDLLRHEYTLDGVPVTVTEARTFVLVAFGDTGAAAGSDPLVEAATMAAQTLSLPPQVQFHWIEGESPYRLLSTSPGTPISRMADWSERIDGVAAADSRGVSLFCYKIKPRNSGMLDTASWFPDEFRTPANP